MPTAKPRIAVTLNDPTFQVIARMAELQGVSRGAVVADLLESVAPVLARTVSLLEAAQEAPRSAKEGLIRVAESVQGDLAGKLGDAMLQMDAFLGEISAASGGHGEGQPPYSNTGVRSGNGSQKRSKQGVKNASRSRKI